MERTAPSGGLHVKYVAGVLTVDKSFQNHPKSSVEEAGKLNCIPTSAGI